MAAELLWKEKKRNGRAPSNAHIVLVMYVFEYDKEKFKVLVENYYKDMIACDSCVRV